MKNNARNKFLTKLFFITLSGALLLGSVSGTAAEELTPPQTAPVTTESTKQDNEDYTKALEVLNELDVFNKSMTFDAASNVERETLAVYAAKLIGVEKKNSDTRYFVDVPETSYGAGSIEYLTRLGIFSQPEDKYFHPEDMVSADELTKVVTSILGYDKYARENGGYPTGYRLAAKRADLYIPTGDQISFKDLVMCFGSALEAKMYEPICFGSNGEVTMVNTGENILSIYHKIYCLDGAVQAIGGMSVNGKIVGDDQILISGVTYDLDSEMYQPDVLGRYVKYYYKDADNKKTVKLIQSYENEKVINIEDILTVNNVVQMNQKGISYYIGYKTRYEDLSKCAYVYNGSMLTSKVDETLKKLNKGSVALCDMDDDDNFDTVVIWNFENFVVSSTSENSMTIANKLNGGGFYRYDDYEKVLVCDAEKNEIDWSDIKAEQILAVAPSNDKNVLFIITSDAAFNGTVETVNAKDPMTITVNGNEYEIERSYQKEFESLKIEAGGVYTFKTDIFGKIGYVENFTTEGSMTFAYIMDSAKSDSVFDDYTLKLKLLQQDGKIEIIELADNTRIDGKVCKGGAKQLSAFVKPEGLKDPIKAPVDRVIRFNKNADGKINVIDTATVGENQTADSSLVAVGGESYAERWYNMGRIGYLTYVNTSKTFVFCVPENPRSANTDDDYTVSNMNLINMEEARTLKIYASSERSEFSEVVVFKYAYNDLRSNYSIDQTKVMMVDNISDVLDDDGSVVKAIEGMVNGGMTTVKIPDGVDISNVGEGDIIRFVYGIKGQIVPGYDIFGKDANKKNIDVLVMYDYSQDQGMAPTESGSNWKRSTSSNGGTLCLYSPGASYYEGYRNEMQLSFGYAAKKNSKYVWWDGADKKLSTEICDLSSVPVVVYDSSRKSGNKIYRGAISDIDDYETVGEGCSRVILNTAGPYKRCLFVFK